MKTATTVTKISTTVQANKTTETVSKQESQKNITTKISSLTYSMVSYNLFRLYEFQQNINHLVNQLNFSQLHLVSSQLLPEPFQSMRP